jgi:predicted phosphodiesterase
MPNHDLLIFSDTHLSEQPDPAKYKFLNHLITTFNGQIIINGDLWDNQLTTFNQFLHSPWRQLFSLLKKRTAIYINGNHDPSSDTNAQSSLFSVLQVDKYHTDYGPYHLKISHGHAQHPGFSQLQGLLPKNINQLIIKSNHIVECGLNQINPNLTAWLYQYRHQENAKLLDFATSHAQKNEVYIFGHTHKAMIDLPNHIANTGDIYAHRASYILAQHNTLKLISTKY